MMGGVVQLLLVEDDALLGAGLRAALGKVGFNVTWVKDGKAALDAVDTQDFVAMVLDVGLPRINGTDVVRSLRAQHNAIPVLVLTATDSTRDKVVCLECGADDFLGKTAEMEELVARLRALVRRAGRSRGSLCVGALRLDLDAHTLTHGGEAIRLTNREFKILRALMEAAGRILTRAQLEESLYGWKDGVDSNAIEVHIHNLRLKLGATVLQTVRGVGYTIVRPGA
jgi:two-component system OmpR family response regulator/two-component system response regulator QseB